MNNNRENIKSVLDELGIIYKADVSEGSSFKVETYLINLIADNNVISGGVLDEYTSENNHLSIMFFFEKDRADNSESKADILTQVNKCNQICRYGNFFLDDDGDIVYSLVIPAIGEEKVSKEVFRFYFDSVISLIKDVAKDLING